MTVLEDESHVWCTCPRYHKHRQELRNRISGQLRTQLQSMECPDECMQAYFSSYIASDWAAIGYYLSGLRQARRQLRTELGAASARFLQRGFVTRKAAWRSRGRTVCRHGVFFGRGYGQPCSCLTNETSESPNWEGVLFMPTLDSKLTSLIVVDFCPQEFKRLGQLQHELRRRQLFRVPNLSTITSEEGPTWPNYPN